jgi:uncharacterized protein (TIGR02118 family)
MHVLTVCYAQPSDPAAFDEYYTSVHIPLARKMPGLASFTVHHCDQLGDAVPPYYLIAQLGFPSREALDAALASPEGRAAGADVPNFAAQGTVTRFVAHD